MQITLMRHGKPMLAPCGRIAPRDMETWIADYDCASIEAAVPPIASLEAARHATVIVTSTLPRARASALALGYPTPRIDALFCETALPFARWHWPRLPPLAWATLFRLAWLAGIADGVEPLKAARTRAQDASRLLMEYAAEGPVPLIGHGIMNRLIARELAAAGWTAAAAQRSGYWATVQCHRT